MISINREAMKVVRRILDGAGGIGGGGQPAAGRRHGNRHGARAPGGWVAGKLYTLVTLGGLGAVSYEPFAVGDPCCRRCAS